VLLLAAGLFIGIIASGDLLGLTRSQLPTELPPTLARASVAVALGLAGGMVLAGWGSIARPRGRPARPGGLVDRDDSSGTADAAKV
jgi:hypothetical protein